MIKNKSSSKKAGHLFNMRVAQDFLDMLDRWRGKQLPIPTRSEAIRQLVEAGIKASS
jgi:hypothetical protein